MSKLEQAEAQLAEAQARHNSAVHAAGEARGNADALGGRIATGDCKVTADDLAKARAVADHAELVADGAQKPLAALGEAVQDARANDECDRVVRTIRSLGDPVVDGLDAIEEALAPFIDAAERFDQFVAAARPSIGNVAQRSPRFQQARHSRPTVDGIPLAECRGASQLAAAIRPAMKELGAPSFFMESLNTLAKAAGPIPTETSR